MTPWKIAAYAVAALAIAGVALKLYMAGVDRALINVERQNNAARDNADLAALGRSECNAARDRGERVRWNFSARKCERLEGVD